MWTSLFTLYMYIFAKSYLSNNNAMIANILYYNLNNRTLQILTT